MVERWPCLSLLSLSLLETRSQPALTLPSLFLRLASVLLAPASLGMVVPGKEASFDPGGGIGGRGPRMHSMFSDPKRAHPWAVRHGRVSLCPGEGSLRGPKSRFPGLPVTLGFWPSSRRVSPEPQSCLRAAPRKHRAS